MRDCHELSLQLEYLESGMSLAGILLIWMEINLRDNKSESSTTMRSQNGIILDSQIVGICLAKIFSYSR